MAKGNRTTSTARRTTVAKATSAAQGRIVEPFGLGDPVAAAAAFGTLQHAIKCLDQLIVNMVDVSDMTEELVDAEKADAELARNYRRRCHARAYKTLQPILTATIRQNAQIETELADFLKTSPTLAHHVARWQADDAKI
jgi:hypothetical protein